jgi:hypothetical protein
MLIDNVVIKRKFHKFYNQNILDDYRKICNSYIFNPKIILQCITNKLKIKPFLIREKYKWIYKNNFLIHGNKFLSNINNKIALTQSPITKWFIKNEYMSDIENNYVTIDLYNNICVSKEKKTKIYYIDNILVIKKSKLQLYFEINNCKNKIQYINTSYFKNNLTGLNVGILLAGGNSTRFNNKIAKQLYIIDNKPIISYSLDLMCKLLDYVVIITNSKLFNDISKLKLKYKNIILLTNDIDCRLESIWTGLKYLKKYNINKVIIHDSARPYLKKYHFANLINSNKLYAHYCQKITNGLFNYGADDIDRDDYVQLCSPLIINYKLAYFIYNNYMNDKNRITWEFIFIIKLLNLDYEFLFDTETHLKKITYFNDIC